MTNGEVVIAVPSVLIALVFASVAASSATAGLIVLGVALLLGGQTWWLFLRDNAYSMRGRWPFLNALAIGAGALFGTVAGVLVGTG